MKLVKDLLKVSLLCLSFYSPLFVYAESDIVITLSPRSPEAYEKVTLNLTTYSIDLDTSLISWNVGGRKSSEGVGIKKIIVEAPGIGESIPISAQITTQTGEITVVTLSLTPRTVSIIWEVPESYTPPFYEGKALPGEGALVRAVALPLLTNGGGIISAKNLSYAWYRNDVFLDSVSGAGKQSAIIRMDTLEEKTIIRVEVRSGSGVRAEKTITIYPHDVLPTLYAYDELLGTEFNKPLKRRFETTKDFTISLEPYYLSRKGSVSEWVSFTWLLDGLPVANNNETLLSFRPQEKSNGIKTLSILVSNSKRKLQEVETSLEILFDTNR